MGDIQNLRVENESLKRELSQYKSDSNSYRHLRNTFVGMYAGIIPGVAVEAVPEISRSIPYFSRYTSIPDAPDGVALMIIMGGAIVGTVVGFGSRYIRSGWQYSGRMNDR